MRQSIKYFVLESFIKLRLFFLSIQKISSLKVTSPFNYKVLNNYAFNIEAKKKKFFSNHRAKLI